jgi:mono/diheme cytochrome c family protein
MPAIKRAFALLIIVMTSVALMPTGARAENIDQDKDKSGPKLFAASCADCHRSARGLAKGRLSIMLWYYLQQHYTSSSATAQTLTAYLQSVDTPPRSKPQPGKSQLAKSQPTATQSTATNGSAPRSAVTQSAATGLSVPRPPALVPGR